MTDSTTEYSKPVQQNVVAFGIFGQYFPPAIQRLIAGHIVGLIMSTDGIDKVDETTECTVGFEPVGFRRWKLSVEFTIMNSATMAGDDEMRDKLYSFMASCGCRKMGSTMERVNT